MGRNLRLETPERSRSGMRVTTSAIDPRKDPEAAPAPTPEPQPPTEFQEFVATAIGRLLPVYGSNLFDRVPTTFAPIDRVPVTADYVVGPGDEVLVRAWGQIDLDAKVIVDRTGNVYLPKVGNLSVAGLRYQQLEEYFRTAIGRMFRNFDLSVNLGQLRSIQVFVVGQARRPGTYTVSSLSTLVNTLFASGGPAVSGSLRHIQLRRQDRVVTELDLYDLPLRGNKSKDLHLLPGDVIYIPPVGPSVAVAGSVNVPAIYELRERTNLGEVLEMSGGLATTADGQKAILERIESHVTRKVEEFPLDPQGLRRELRDGDLVRIQAISPKFENAVILRGNVAEPGRYPWREGMHLHDLIPNREFLLTRKYWRRQNEISTSAVLDGDGEERSDATTLHPANSMRNTNIATNRIRSMDGLQSGDKIRFGDGIQSGNEIQSGEVRNEVRRNAPEINWDYAVIQRTDPETLAANLIPFNLENAIQEDGPEENLLLLPGDIVTIFSQKDMTVAQERQSKFVRLEGEFRAPGVYKVQPGESLRALVARVGGLSSGAYLFGTQFTREAARLEQQKSLDQMTHELEMEVERCTITAARAKTEQPEALEAARASEHALVEKFRQFKASGRIGLEITPAASGAEAFPAIPLEDGDRVYVPHKPATVSVVGSVYNQNSFLFRGEMRVADYLKIAGNGNRDADLKHLFLVRADGSVLSQPAFSRWRGGSLVATRTLPGDTVVVPAQLAHGSAMRGLKDWTQILSQMALGAAAINVLK